MKIYLLSLLAFVFLSLNGVAQCTEPFFSEYIEGTSNNKAIEFVNPSSAPINLANYKVYRYNNGSPTPTDSLQPVGMLAPGDVYVAGNPSAIASIVSASDTLHTITFFNGDDAMELRNMTTGATLDIIGIIGIDPGTNWAVGSGATSEFTLVRMAGIQQGTTNWAQSVTEWNVYPQNTDTALGTHTMISCCAVVSGTLVFSSGVSCNGGSDGMAVVQASGGNTFTFAWSPAGGTDDTASALVTGTYTCIVTNECSNTATVTVTINEPAALSAMTDSIVVPGCSQANGALGISVSGGTAPYVCAWPNGDSVTFADSLSAGTYTVMITDANGCSFLFTETLNNPPAPVVTLSIPGPDTVCLATPAFTLTGEDPEGGTWSGPGVTGNQFDASTTSPGWNLINYFYTDTNNCAAMATDSLFVDVCTGMNMPVNAAQIHVYPNPAHDFITVTLPAMTVQLVLRDAAGRCMATHVCAISRETIDLGGLAAGVYVLEVQGANGTRSFVKVLKE